MLYYGIVAKFNAFCKWNSKRELYSTQYEGRGEGYLCCHGQIIVVLVLTNMIPVAVYYITILGLPWESFHAT